MRRSGAHGRIRSFRKARNGSQRGRKRRRSSRRQSQYDIHGQYGCLRQRQSRHNSHRHGYRNGQDSHRPCKCCGRKNPASDEAGTAFKNTYMARFGNMCVHIRIQRYKERRLWYRIASQYVYNSCKPCRRRNTGRSCRSCNDSAFHGCYENVKARRCNTPSYSR